MRLERLNQTFVMCTQGSHLGTKTLEIHVCNCMPDGQEEIVVSLLIYEGHSQNGIILQYNLLI